MSKNNSNSKPNDLYSHPERRLRRPEVEIITGLSTATIYRGIENGTFPRPQRISERTVAWKLGDILNFLASRPTTSTYQEEVA